MSPMPIKHADYLLCTDTLSVGELLEKAPDKSPRGTLTFAKKMRSMSEHNLRMTKALYERHKEQYKRQLTNATYWGMAVDIAEEELKGGLQ
tara:strand:+ start:186 stop:458 length:273 start_codon:yes stop_codon:yes gene_type:complete